MALILASTSPIRRQLLVAAGVEAEAVTPDFDEEWIKSRHVGDGPSLALRLAEGKALSLGGSGDWSIGADSTLTLEGRRFSKPRDRADAAAHLAAFSGRTMELSSAVALARTGRIEWRHVDTAQLEVRPLSPAFIESYLDAEWPDVGYCVGVFRLEGHGVQLFERIDGDQFTVLGLPLLPLLGALRRFGLMPS